MVSSTLRARRAFLLAGTSLLLAVPSAAFAQDTTQPPTDQPQPADTAPTPGNPEPTDQQPQSNDAIIVTGIRRGIQTSIDTKRREQGIVEAVSAEDIGKLPDISIAESIARLPGIAAQRVNGRAQVISIRGLAPDFTTTLLNGRQQASSGDNRAVEFDQYPSELLASVVIYKTPDANIAGFGLSGTADLRTVRPLNFKNRTVAVNVRGEMNGGGKLNDDVKNWGGRASISYIDKITPELGFAVGCCLPRFAVEQPSHQGLQLRDVRRDCCRTTATQAIRLISLQPRVRPDCAMRFADWPGNLRLLTQQQAPRCDRHPRMGAERSRPLDPRSLLFALQAARDDARRAMVLQPLGRRPRPSPMWSPRIAADRRSRSAAPRTASRRSFATIITSVRTGCFPPV